MSVTASYLRTVAEWPEGTRATDLNDCWADRLAMSRRLVESLVDY